MARIRSIHPEFWDDEEIGCLSRNARLLFLACWNVADDEGLLRWVAAYLKSSAFIYDDDVTTEHVQALMDELVEAGLVLPYKGGKAKQSLGWIISFRKYQKPNRPQPSKLPPPSLHNAKVREAYAERDGWCCSICGEHIPSGPELSRGFDDDLPRAQTMGLSLDHIVSRADGGSDHPSNIRAVHAKCNSVKGSRSDSVNDSRNEESRIPGPFTSGEERRGEEREKETEGESEGEVGALRAPGPPAGGPSVREPPLARVWQRGLEAAGQYRSPPPRWKLTDAYRRPLKALVREEPERGDDVFAAVVHGYRAARAGWDQIEAHFSPKTLLRAANRAEYLEAYDQALAQGMRPPFRWRPSPRSSDPDDDGPSEKEIQRLERLREEALARRAQSR